MKKLYLVFLVLFLSTTVFAQIDKSSKQLLDSLGIKFDPNDPDAELKLEQQLKEKFLAKYDSAMKVAGNTVIDPFNTQGLLNDIANDINEGIDTTSTTYEFMQELPVLEIFLDHPDRRFVTENGFDLPANLHSLFITGNGKSIPIDLSSLIEKLSSSTVTELYLTRDNEGISEIPTEIGTLKNLRVLALYGNNLSQLPPSIGELSQLEVLYIDANPIKEISGNIGGLKNLRTLGIAKTQISATEQANIQKLLPNCQILLK